MPPRSWRDAALVFALVWFSCAWFGSWEWNPNSSTRLFAAIALVEDGSARIDDLAPLTIDKAEFGGHFYLDKAPGMTLMALAPVAIVDAATHDDVHGYRKALGDDALARFLRIRLRVAAALGPGLLTALAAALLYDLALGLTGSRGGALAVAIGYALGTPIWGWSTTLFGHAAVAALFVIAVWAAWRATLGAGRPVPAGIAGAALGWAFVVEYQAALAGAAIAIWALARAWPLPARGRLIVAAAVGGTTALVPLVAYDEVAFGVPFRFGYSGVVGWEGMHQGFFGLTRPNLFVLNELVFGTYRGLFWLSPAMLAAAFGLRALVRDRATRGIGWMAAAVVAIMFLLNASYVYWDGGNSTGPRLAMPMAGLLALGLAPLYATATRHQRIGIAALVALSVVINLVVAAADIVVPPPWRFPLWSVVIRQRLLFGDLRTLPSEWLGTSVWTGLALWALVALPLFALLIRRPAPPRAVQPVP